MSEQDLITELNCARLMTLTSYYADRHDIEGFLGLFTKDGIIDRLGEPFVGTEAIRGFLERRPRERVTRHLLTPAAIEITGADSAHGCAFFTLYDGIGTDDEILPLRAPVLIGEYHQEYRRVDGAWKVARHSVKAVFRSITKEA